MVLARRLNERRLADAKKQGKEEGRKEGRVEGLKTANKHWQAWYDSLPEEVREQQSPPPSPSQDEED